MVGGRKNNAVLWATGLQGVMRSADCYALKEPQFALFFSSPSVSAAKSLREGFCQEGHCGRTQTRPCFTPRGIIGPDICTAGCRSSVGSAAALHSLCLWSSKAAIRPKKFAVNETQQIESMWFVYYFYLSVEKKCQNICCVISLAIICLSDWDDLVSVLFRHQSYINATVGSHYWFLFLYYFIKKITLLLFGMGFFSWAQTFNSSIRVRSRFLPRVWAVLFSAP